MMARMARIVDVSVPRVRTGSRPVPESDSGESEKRYCCAEGETPHRWPAKLAAIPRKAGG